VLGVVGFWGGGFCGVGWGVGFLVGLGVVLVGCVCCFVLSLFFFFFCLFSSLSLCVVFCMVMFVETPRCLFSFYVGLIMLSRGVWGVGFCGLFWLVVFGLGGGFGVNPRAWGWVGELRCLLVVGCSYWCCSGGWGGG